MYKKAAFKSLLTEDILVKMANTMVSRESCSTSLFNDISLPVLCLQGWEINELDILWVQNRILYFW